MGVLAFLNMIFLRLLGLLVSAVLVWTVPPVRQTTIEPTDKDNLRLQFTALSDVHMESFTYERFQGFSKTLRDIGASQKQQDALVLLGDNTMNGQPTEYIMLYSLLYQYNKPANTIVAMGNHDLNPGTYDTQDAIDRHNFFLRTYNGTNNSVPYYATKIKGYSFIVLGDEDPQEDTAATISQAQLDWFAQTMQSAAADGKPIFVFLHQPLNHTFSSWWGGVGEQSEALRATAEQYDNVFFFNGHLHWYQDMMESGGVTYISLPTLLSDDEPGIGFQVEVYEDEVLLRARNYIEGEWLEDDAYRIELK